MTKIEEYNDYDGAHSSLIFPCDCHDHHFLHFEWDEEDTDWRYIYVSNQWRPVRWRDKIKSCYKILRNREYSIDEVVLNDKSIDALKKFLEGKGSSNPPRNGLPVK